MRMPPQAMNGMANETPFSRACLILAREETAGALMFGGLAITPQPDEERKRKLGGLADSERLIFRCANAIFLVRSAGSEIRFLQQKICLRIEDIERVLFSNQL